MLCNEICHRAGIEPGTPANSIKSEKLSVLTRVLQNITNTIKSGEYSPNVVIDENLKKAVDFHVIKLTSMGGSKNTAASVRQLTIISDILPSKTL
nr:NFACT family protein [Thermoclostridium stercorarium]